MLRITEKAMTLIESKEIKSDGPKIPLLVRGIAIVMSIYQLFTGLFQLTAMNQRVTHVTFALVLIYFYYSFGQKKRERITWDGYLLAGIALVLGIFVLSTWFTKVGQIGMAPPVYELALGTVFILLCVEAARRTLG